MDPATLIQINEADQLAVMAEVLNVVADDLGKLTTHSVFGSEKYPAPIPPDKWRLYFQNFDIRVVHKLLHNAIAVDTRISRKAELQRLKDIGENDPEIPPALKAYDVIKDFLDIYDWQKEVIILRRVAVSLIAILIAKDPNSDPIIPFENDFKVENNKIFEKVINIVKYVNTKTKLSLLELTSEIPLFKLNRGSGRKPFEMSTVKAEHPTWEIIKEAFKDIPIFVPR